MPLNFLCANKDLDELAATEILKLLIEKCPGSAQHVDSEGDLPIHLAVQEVAKSPEFCRVLIEAYPDSIQVSDSNGVLPLHYACMYNTVATVQCLYKLYPDAINHGSTNGVTAGLYPIHFAIGRDDLVVSLEIIKFLLDCDPNVKLQKLQGVVSMLHVVCGRGCNDDSNIQANLEMIKTIYDAHPEAIEDDGIVSSIQHFQQEVQTFIGSELVYARQARDHRLMMTPDDNGRLPLHRALQDYARLGSIKLLVKGNPAALQYSDFGGALPLHIACQHHDSVSVIQYLIGLDTTTLDAADRGGNTPLHYACRGAKYKTIAMLLDKYDAMSVSERNADNELPINLLWESYFVTDRESVEYTESVYRLLQAHPEMQACEH